MAGRLAAPLPKSLQLAQRQAVAAEVQQAVKQHGAVSSRKDKAIAIRPQRVGGIVFEEARP